MNGKYKLNAILLAAAAIAASGCTDSDVNSNTSSTSSQKIDSAVSESATERKVFDYDPDKPVIALTFDDGPNTTATPMVLDRLEKYNVTASFFLIGNNINEQSAEVSKRAYYMGCEIDNHSLTHSDMTAMTEEEIKDEISQTSEKIFQITGEYPSFFRPPYIAVNQTMTDSIDLPFISGYGANDWDNTVTAEQRAEKVLAQAKDGAIILLHDMDGNYQTVEALDTIIPALLDEGYQFVTVSQLFEAKNITPKTDELIVYSYAEQTTAY
jgi:peptidoglycan/xylan/chitin deacetylase (PgdA/CDA1 family)